MRKFRNLPIKLVYFMALAIMAMAAITGLAKAESTVAEVGKPAPNFTAADVINGGTFNLSAQKGKMVVLEWTNHECPYVIKHYDTGNMQKTQKAAVDQGVVWVSIVSSAPGRQGHVNAEEAKKIVTDNNAHPTFKILDKSGDIGHLYAAKTTPHMFVISPEGVLVYAGAIDDQPSPRHETVEGAKNYVLAALDDFKEGNAVQTTATASYGCGIKYAY